MIKKEIIQIERPWGNFRQFTNNSSSTVKIINVKPKEVLSLQSHNHRAEFWYIIKGSGTVQIGENMIEVIAGDEFEILVGEKHRLGGGENGIQVLEIAIGDFNEEDIVRYEDKYKRV